MATWRERYHELDNKQYEDWYTLVFASPAARFFLAFLADKPWVTPNRLTLVGFVLKVIAIVGVALRSVLVGADLVFLVALHLHLVADTMDGLLARHRKACSSFGAFVDGVGDWATLFALTLALSVQAYLHTTWDLGEWRWILLVVGPLGATMTLYLRYMFRVHTDMKLARGVERTPMADFRRLPFGRWLLRAFGRLLLFRYTDLFFWMSLAVIFDLIEIFILVYGTLEAIKATKRFFERAYQLHKMDERLGE